MKKRLFPMQQWLLGSCFGAGLFLVLVSFAQAETTPSVTLTVNNGASAAILNGQPVQLDWYATGVTNCVINNGVGAIPNGELPSGGRTVTPPDNLQTVYTMTCETVDGGSTSDTSTVSAPPGVSLWVVEGDPVSADPLSGTAAITLEWYSEYATECSNITWVRESGSTGSASDAQNIFNEKYKTS